MSQKNSQLPGVFWVFGSPITIIGIILIAVFVAGCATLPDSVSEPRLAGADDYEILFKTTENVLKKYRFRVDRKDRRLGLVTTAPMTGKSFFEFWRKDAADFDSCLESTLQTIYKTATVTFTPDEYYGWQVNVDVACSRASRRHAELVSTSQAMSLYKLQRGSRKYRNSHGEDPDFAAKRVKLAGDTELADIIRREILHELNQQLDSDG